MFFLRQLLLCYFNVPGNLKNLIDRQLPMSLPFMSEEDNQIGSGGHDRLCLSDMTKSDIILCINRNKFKEKITYSTINKEGSKHV